MKILKKWRRSLHKRMIRCGIASPKVIVQVDGGICSQMFQYLIGQLFVSRGYNVYYDVSFYTDCGYDMLQMFVRNFDLLKAFPYLNMPLASQEEVSLYKNYYYHEGNNTGSRVEDFSFMDMKPPVYLGGYYYIPPKLRVDSFHSVFTLSASDEVLDAVNQRMCSRIKEKRNSVGVHVRRGDLKVYLWAYGKPATNDYFNRAVSYMKENVPDPYFYFFSDEPDWVKEELLPELDVDGCSHVVDINGSDKGYMDLYLIACCKHQVASKGSLGKVGAMLGDCPEKLTVLCDDTTEYYWKEMLHHPVFL